MKSIAEDESVRLEQVHELRLLDTEPEAEFDEVVELAAAICETPIALMTLVDADRQWFKSSVGMQTRETPRDSAFCAQAIKGSDLFVVEDATKDDRFRHNPLVIGEPYIRFYAGFPLEMASGHKVGTLCVIDQVPRRLSSAQQNSLAVLARQMKARIELRVERRKLELALLEKDEIQMQLQSREKVFRVFMDSSPFVSYIKSEDGRYEYYNKRFCELFCTDDRTWLGTRDIDHFPVEQAAGYRANDLKAISQGAIVATETSVDVGGSTQWWESHKFGYVDPLGRRLLGGISVDVTREYTREIELQASKLELEELNAQLKLLTLTDALTGMRNRRAFEERLQLEFTRAQQRERALSVVMLDIDFFKKVNDELGHAAGDVVLCEIGAILRASVRSSDMAARFGGEEFVVVLSETDAGNALLWSRRLELSLSHMNWQHRPVTLSMGIAELTPGVQDVADLIGRADEALYDAKRAGRAQSSVYGLGTDLPGNPDLHFSEEKLERRRASDDRMPCDKNK